MKENSPKGLKVLPVIEGRIAEGGQRTKGCYKTSELAQPLISIIVVVLNRANCFERCIKSIIDRSYKNIEFIVIDGASTDGTLELLRKYDNQIDYWVSEPDLGLYYAMNKALEIANGDWLNFVGSDDVMLDCLATVVPRLSDNRTIYYGDVYGIGKKRNYNGPFTRYRLHAQGIHHQGTFYPRSVFSDFRYDTTYRIAADWDLNLRCLFKGNFKFNYLHALVVVYNDIDGLSALESARTVSEFRSINRRWLGFVGMIYNGRWSLTHLLKTMHCNKFMKRVLYRLTEAKWRFDSKFEDKVIIAKRLVRTGVSVYLAAEIVCLSVDEVRKEI